jgi:Cu-Zn family superoxide dismutase
MSAVSLSVLGLSACTQKASGGASDGGGASLDAAWPKFDECISVIQGTKGNEGVHGVVRFKQKSDGVEVTAEIAGLAPETVHAIHIHEFGDINCEFGKCQGGHFNPSGSKHGGPESPERHAGDMGNLKADSMGKAVYTYVDKVIQLRGKDSILGRGVTLHAGPDDFTTQPTGGAGARIGMGVIGIADKKK